MKLTETELSILRKLAATERRLRTFELKAPGNELCILRSMDFVKPEWYTCRDCFWTITDAGRKALQEIDSAQLEDGN